MTPDHLMSYTFGGAEHGGFHGFFYDHPGLDQRRPREERPLGDDAAGFGRERDEYLPAAIE